VNGSNGLYLYGMNLGGPPRVNSKRRRYQTFGKDGHCRYQQRPMINMSPTVKRERVLMRETAVVGLMAGLKV
jgi:hypothetical protein